MAIQVLSRFKFSTLVATAFYDDEKLLITRVEVDNSGDNAVSITVQKYNPPAKTFSQIFQPHTNVGYDVPAGFKLIIEEDEFGEPELLTPLTITIGGV